MHIATERGQELLALPLSELLRRHHRITAAHRQSEMALAVPRRARHRDHAANRPCTSSRSKNDAGELLRENYDDTTDR